MLIYAQSNPNFIKYGTLDRGDLVIRVLLADTGEDLYLEGVKLSTTILELRKTIEKDSGIHHSRQKLFIGGEEMGELNCLLDYFPTAHHAQAQGDILLTLRCYIPILLSTLHCPGPMLSEIEVRPRNDEPVISVKRKICDKFCIENDAQRLHVHPSEMTTWFLRQPLDDARLLSCYLSPGRGGNFLEVIVVEAVEQTHYNEQQKELYVRVPYEVTNTLKSFGVNELCYSNELHCPTTNNTDAVQPQTNYPTDSLPPPPPPQTPESDVNNTSRLQTPFDHNQVAQPRLETWWITFPISIDEVIKRDPKVEDVMKIITQAFKHKRLSFDRITGSDKRSLNGEKSFFAGALKYCDAKLSRGGLCFNPSDLIYKDLLMKREEMLMFLITSNIPESLHSIPLSFYGSEPPPQNDSPVISSVTPIEPLESYSDKLVLFTSPPDPVKMKWKIEPSSEIDCGATPEINLELTGLSYNRKYGSWDIPKHEKTYVEVILEGSFSVGDSGYESLVALESDKGFVNHNQERTQRRNLVHNESQTTEKIVYYVQDKMEVIIFGPFSPSLYKSLPLSLNKPFGTSAKTFVSERKKIFDFQQEVRKGELKNPPMPKPAPFYKRFDERNIQKTSTISNDVIASWKDQRQLSKNVIGQWCLSRERVSNVIVTSGQEKAPTKSSKIFTTQCDRGTWKDGRPFIKVVYERKLPISSSPQLLFPKSQHFDSIRNSFDFRIQAQFQISQLLEDKVDLGGKSDFKIAIRHWVTRVEHSLHTPDHCTQFESPSKDMNTTLKVNLATDEWVQSTGQQPLPITELQEITS